MNKIALHNILSDLMMKYGVIRARELNKFLGIKNSSRILRSELDKISSEEYVTYISKFIYEGLFL